MDVDVPNKVSTSLFNASITVNLSMTTTATTVASPQSSATAEPQFRHKHRLQRLLTLLLFSILTVLRAHTPRGEMALDSLQWRIRQLAPTDSTDCTYAWQKTNGTLYWFHADQSNGNCGITQATTGHIQEIFARNQQNYITFTYSYTGSGSGPENVSGIVAQHSDGQSLTLTFGIVPHTAINQLKSITRRSGLLCNILTTRAAILSKLTSRAMWL